MPAPLFSVHISGGPRRVNHAAVSFGNGILSFGGYCTGEDYRTSRPMDVYFLNIETFRWQMFAIPSQNSSAHFNIPFMRYGHTAVVFEKTAYIWGGRNDLRACNTLFKFDPFKNEWSKPHTTGYLPGKRDGHSACIIKSHMYVFGGYEDDTDQFSRDVFCLNLSTMVWSLVITEGQPPTFRDFQTSSALGLYMYVFGGRSDRHGAIHTENEVYDNNLYRLDTITSTWKTIDCPSKPSGRRSHSAFVYNGKLYIFGGYNSVMDKHFNDLHVFNTVAGTWTELSVHGTRPCVRRRQACCVVGDKAILFGGTSPKYQDCARHRPLLFRESGLVDHNDLHVLDLNPKLKSYAARAVLDNKIGFATAPTSLRSELEFMSQPNCVTRVNNQTG